MSETTTWAVGPEQRPIRIGTYRILETLGEGGMGVVYLAEQEAPVRRKVALKLIKLGMDTKEVVARFESERQALALMNHPNIAAVLDAGATDLDSSLGVGRPYFVMEYVPGEPITVYCDKHKLTIQARLELFIQVCNAVQHAHQKAIIHRDLKPSNILVMLQEHVGGPRPVPKIIDFGVAKATNQRLTENTVFTQHGVLIGTPEYMSPEQAEMTQLDIDTRTDVYSLGVLLYELLTGTLPFERDTLRRAGLAEIQRIIREVEPAKPSTRLSSLTGKRDHGEPVLAAGHAEQVPTPVNRSIDRIAASRKCDPYSLSRQLRGDLDWIAIKCLAKDRIERYATVAELALDISKHINNEPVSARRPSAFYRLEKLIRRNRAGFMAAAAIVVTLLLGIVGTTSGLVWALGERTRADAEAQNAKSALIEQRRAREDAQRSADEQRKLAESERELRTTLDRNAKAFASGIRVIARALYDDPLTETVSLSLEKAIDRAVDQLQSEEIDAETKQLLMPILASIYFRMNAEDKAMRILAGSMPFKPSVPSSGPTSKAGNLILLSLAQAHAAVGCILLIRGDEKLVAELMIRESRRMFMRAFHSQGNFTLLTLHARVLAELGRDTEAINTLELAFEQMVDPERNKLPFERLMFAAVPLSNQPSEDEQLSTVLDVISRNGGAELASGLKKKLSAWRASTQPAKRE